MSKQTIVSPHLYYAAAIFLSVLLIVSYLFYKDFKESSEKREAQQQVEWEKKSKRLLLDACFADSQSTYELNWAGACKTTASTAQQGYKNCLNNMDDSICKSIWGKIDSSPNCALPANSATALNERSSGGAHSALELLAGKLQIADGLTIGNGVVHNLPVAQITLALDELIDCLAQDIEELEEDIQRHRSLSFKGNAKPDDA